MVCLSEELRAWISLGHAGVVCTADESRRPDTMRLWAARAEDEGSALRFVVIASDGDRITRNLSENPVASVTLVSPETYRSIQLKGPCAPSPERRLSEAYVAQAITAFSRACAAVGIRGEAGPRLMSYYEAPDRLMELCLEIDAIFDQTPRPGAGKTL